MYSYHFSEVMQKSHEKRHVFSTKEGTLPVGIVTLSKAMIVPCSGDMDSNL